MAMADRRWDSRRKLAVQDAVSGCRHTLVLSGELDIASAGQLEATIRRICATGTTALVLDLTKLTAMDSSGLRLILAAGGICEKNGHDFLLMPGPRSIQEVFKLTGLADRLPFQHVQPPYNVTLGRRRRSGLRAGTMPVTPPALTVGTGSTA
jgi:anti-sigma B factor antagonist